MPKTFEKFIQLEALHVAPALNPELPALVVQHEQPLTTEAVFRLGNPAGAFTFPPEQLDQFPTLDIARLPAERISQDAPFIDVSHCFGLAQSLGEQECP